MSIKSVMQAAAKLSIAGAYEWKSSFDAFGIWLVNFHGTLAESIRIIMELIMRR